LDLRFYVVPDSEVITANGSLARRSNFGRNTIYCGNDMSHDPCPPLILFARADVAARLGKTLHADKLVVGSIRATAAGISFTARILDVGTASFTAESAELDGRDDRGIVEVVPRLLSKLGAGSDRSDGHRRAVAVERIRKRSSDAAEPQYAK